MAFAGTRDNGPACGCCGPDTCTIQTDDFSGDLSAWTEVEATTAIASGRLRLTGARALIIHDTLHPDAVSGSGGDSRVNVLAYPDTSGGDVQYLVLVAYDDADNYLFLAVFDGDTECSWMRLGQRLAGSETWLTEERPLPALSTSRNLFLCWQASTGMLTAHIGSGTEWPNKVYLEAEVTSGLDGDQVGLEFSTGAGQIEFDNFDWKYHKSDTQTTCPECLPPCVFFADSDPAAGCDWMSETSGLISTHFNPQPTEGTKLTVTFDPTSATDAGSIIFDWIDDDNFRRVEVDSNGTSGTIKLFRKVGGSETQIDSETLASYDGSGTITIEVCWFGEVVRVAAIYSTTVRDSFTSAEVGGTLFGVVGTGTFTDFFAQSLAIECDPCDSGTGPACGPFDETPEYMILDIAGLVDGTRTCEDFNLTILMGLGNCPDFSSMRCEPFDTADIESCCYEQSAAIIGADTAVRMFAVWWIVLLDDGHYWLGVQFNFHRNLVPYDIDIDTTEYWKDMGTTVDIFNIDETFTAPECNFTDVAGLEAWCDTSGLVMRLRSG